MEAMDSKKIWKFNAETIDLANNMHLGNYQVTRTAVLNHVAPFVPIMMMAHICHYSQTYEAQANLQHRTGKN